MQLYGEVVEGSKSGRQEGPSIANDPQRDVTMPVAAEEQPAGTSEDADVPRPGASYSKTMGSDY